MSKNITLMGASYPDVPSVVLPQTGGGTATFTDVTGTTAIDSDVAAGKYFFTASGILTLGTGTGGTDGDLLEYGVQTAGVVGGIVGTATIGVS